jgi:hypothetical protein
VLEPNRQPVRRVRHGPIRRRPAGARHLTRVALTPALLPHFSSSSFFTERALSSTRREQGHGLRRSLPRVRLPWCLIVDMLVLLIDDGGLGAPSPAVGSTRSARLPCCCPPVWMHKSSAQWHYLRRCFVLSDDFRAQLGLRPLTIPISNTNISFRM